jgi:hypothetical protein
VRRPEDPIRTVTREEKSYGEKSSLIAVDLTHGRPTPDIYYGRDTRSRQKWIRGAGELNATLYLRNISQLICTIRERN